MPANWFDHAIATVAPRAAARRVLARQAFETLARGYDGTAKGRRTDGWRARGSSADTEIGVAGALLRDRMRDLVRNNPHYTGLRSFTEEESLYFKGREKDIEQASQQLQKNKFLMLTGASGDGKSSLIYAGIVPNARAGFLKSKYTSWRVADFRPERTPFLNLCKALAKQLNIPEQATVESELRHGFSALVDLYKNSPCYLDPELKAYLQGDEGQRSATKRQTANLIIIVDQFEEFFTNPENYKHGVPSNDANLVLNLLLETARIALDEDLPIFIVFTMRSDFIGQCAAFRSLPEYIGFSQFFVPRLNRSQLQQVIEEPAWLSGNRITRRFNRTSNP